MARGTIKAITAASLCIILSACGGGGGESDGESGAGAAGIGNSLNTGTGSSGSGAASSADESGAPTPGGNASGNSGSSASSNPGTNVNTGSNTGSGTTVPAYAYDAAARFNRPTDIQADSGGNLYVLDSGNKTVRRIAPDGNVTTVSRAFSNPVGITLDAAGNLYVNDDYRTIYKLLPGGEQSMTPNYTINAMAVDASNNLFVLTFPYDGSVKIIRVSPDGEETVFAELGTRYSGLAIDRDGNVYTMREVFGDRTLVRISPQGVSSDVASGLYDVDPYLANLAVDAAGNVYLSYHIQNRPSPGASISCGSPMEERPFYCNVFESATTIKKVSPQGAVSVVRTGPPGSTGQQSEREYDSSYGKSYIAVGADGNLYATYRSNQTVYRISQSGEPSLYAGKPGESGSAD